MFQFFDFDCAGLPLLLDSGTIYPVQCFCKSSFAFRESTFGTDIEITRVRVRSDINKECSSSGWDSEGLKLRGQRISRLSRIL